MIITTGPEKAFNESNIHSLTKTQQTRNRRNFLFLLKGIYEKPTANIILAGEIVNASLKTGNKFGINFKIHELRILFQIFLYPAKVSM